MDFSRYFEFAEGTTLVILSCPHGGYKKPQSIPNKKEGYKNPDVNTYFLPKLIINSLKPSGVKKFYFLNKIKRLI